MRLTSTMGRIGGFGLQKLRRDAILFCIHMIRPHTFFVCVGELCVNIGRIIVVRFSFHTNEKRLVFISGKCVPEWARICMDTQGVRAGYVSSYVHTFVPQHHHHHHHTRWITHRRIYIFRFRLLNHANWFAIRFPCGADGHTSLDAGLGRKRLYFFQHLNAIVWTKRQFSTTHDPRLRVVNVTKLTTFIRVVKVNMHRISTILMCYIQSEIYRWHIMFTYA